jgi:hypothetical protein
MILNRNFQLASDMFETVSHNQHIRLALDYQYITHSFLAISSNHHYTFGEVENQIVTKEVVIAGVQALIRLPLQHCLSAADGHCGNGKM